MARVTRRRLLEIGRGNINLEGMRTVLEASARDTRSSFFEEAASTPDLMVDDSRDSLGEEDGGATSCSTTKSSEA
ncbi:hypothetical protein M6B38_312510 [Iris pallida]|uniref:Uncharacterized protein n=1 Tax=Iris pallida TaxID=29817 RepID=A0AAX6HG91_IRIPA|nr:hypothetical protein M6B38_312510 [Iris pallida]